MEQIESGELGRTRLGVGADQLRVGVEHRHDVADRGDRDGELRAVALALVADHRRHGKLETSEIGAAAAIAVEQPVHLFLFVKVRRAWGDDPERYREMGLEFPKE